MTQYNNQSTPGISTPMYPPHVCSGCILYYDPGLSNPRILDYSGLNRHVTQSGGIFVPTAGGHVWKGDGLDDHLYITSKGLLPEELTVEVWCKLTGNDPGVASAYRRSVIDTGNVVSAYGIGYNYALSRWECAIRNAGNTIYSINVPVAKAPLNQWNRFVMVAGRGYFHIYVNHAIEPSDPVQIVSPRGSAVESTLRISSYQGTSRYWAGEVGLVKVYKRALTPAEVENNYKLDAWRYGNNS